ncbi:hypothetical protein J3R83DRAFT_7910, partial [Lanmaoa asiatica]
GISIMMFIGTIWSLTYRRKYGSVNKGLIIVACLMLLFSTAHMVIDIVRTYEGLIQYRNEGPIQFFSDVAQWSFVYKNLIYTLQNMVGDGVVVRRRARSQLIISSSASCSDLSLLRRLAISGGSSPFPSHYGFLSQVGISPMHALPRGVRILSSLCHIALLAFRIWKVGRRATRLSPHATVLWPVLRIILDAGVLYSLSLLAALLCFVGQNRGHYVLIDIVRP